MTDDMTFTLEELFKIEDEGICPWCGDEVDTGMGFGKRDLECANEECDFAESYPLEMMR